MTKPTEELSDRMGTVEERGILIKFHLDNIYLEDRSHEDVIYPVINIVPCGYLSPPYGYIVRKKCESCNENNRCIIPHEEIISNDIRQAIKNTGLVQGSHLRERFMVTKSDKGHPKKYYVIISFVDPASVSHTKIDNNSIHSDEELLLEFDCFTYRTKILHQLWSPKDDLSNKIILPHGALSLDEIIRAYYLNLKDYMRRNTFHVQIP